MRYESDWISAPAQFSFRAALVALACRTASPRSTTSWAGLPRSETGGHVACFAWDDVFVCVCVYRWSLEVCVCACARARVRVRIGGHVICFCAG